MSSRLALVLALASLAGEVMASPPDDKGERLVLAVGNDRGLVGEAPLRHAGRDAARVAAVLKALGGFDDARVLVNRSAAELDRALDRLAARTAARAARGALPALVVLYYSGHGAAEQLHLDGDRVAVARLKRRLTAIPARLRLLIVDACRTAGRARRKGFARDRRPFAISLRAPAGPGGVAVVRSSSAGEAAQESDDLRGAIFTHYLVSALRGGGDRDGDQRVTLAEAYAYAYAHTLRRSASSHGPVQHPAAELAVSGAGPLVLTRTAAAKARLTLPAERDGHYLIFRQPAGTAVAEVWSTPGRALTLALEPGRFLVQRRHRRRPGASSVLLARGEHRRLSAGDFLPVPTELLARKGGGLVLRRHRLALGYGLALGPRTNRPGHRLSLGYGYRLGALTLSLEAQLGIDLHRGQQQDTDERWIGGALGLDWLLLARGRLALTLSARLALRSVWQHAERTDAARLEAAGYASAASADSRALALGPGVGLGLGYALSSSLTLSVGVLAEAIALREQGEIAADLRLGGATSLQVAF